MEQGPAGAIGFREVDSGGNPIRSEATAVGDEDYGRGRSLAVNPFIAALWILTITLISGGAWVFLNANSMVGPSAGGMPTSFLVFTFAPYAIFAGLAALVCLLFWHALQWQRRRR
ncbi:UNVERIFIED_CONTAM: hypothetical protein Q9R71_22915 [Actinomycetes bacterium ARC8]|uniref:hypothetical protein n=1 Tax=Pseudarthrobacter sp. NCCP-2145 TaxID=2942290 RepID=UPI00203AEFDD|nr:hypothetical protein [Pseudarthrobacter sp. NCCP-2145]MDV2980027.1 hypothetical protein [Actinomycetes bacterium ARC8]GKV74800.1 hypothetical protein NCCP2145_41810 [Pseudarthrobacter sp. NCCP-2145]